MISGQIEKYAKKIMPVIIKMIEDNPAIIKPLVKSMMKESLTEYDIDLKFDNGKCILTISYDEEVLQTKEFEMQK